MPTEDPQVRAIYPDFKAVMGVDAPENTNLMLWAAATNMLLKAVTKAGTITDTKQVAAALRTLPVEDKYLGHGHWSGLATAAWGWLFQLLLVERVVDDHLATLILTMGLYMVISNGVLVTFGPASRQFAFPLTGTLRFAGLYMPVANLVVLGICLLAIGSVYLLMYRTGLGRALRSRMTGISRRPRACGPVCYSRWRSQSRRAWRDSRVRW